jgi:hypothetical protein
MDRSLSKSQMGRMTARRALAVGALLVAIGVGCHSSSTANLGAFSSSIPGDTQFDQLSAAQAQTFCNEVASFETSSGQTMDDLEITCLFGGLLAAELSPTPQTNASVQAACTTAYDQCLGQATTTFDCPSMAALSACTATVSEYAACLNDATKVDVQAIQSLPTCADLTVADLTTSSGPSQAVPLPQSCETFDAKCPSVAIGNPGGTDGGAGQGGSGGSTGGAGAGAAGAGGGAAGAAGSSGAAGAGGAGAACGGLPLTDQQCAACLNRNCCAELVACQNDLTCAGDVTSGASSALCSSNAALSTLDDCAFSNCALCGSFCSP